MKLSIRDLDLAGKRLFIRVDFNVPLENGEVGDDTRIRASVPTIKYAVEHGATVILASHLGRPKGQVNPFALKVLESYGYPTDGLASKSWEVFSAPDAPKMDFVLTVCDNAAGEACPLWPGQPITAHWGIEDPAAVEGSDIDKERAFVTAFRYLENRISLLVNLPTASLSRLALTARLRDIGRIEGSTAESTKVA